MLELLRERGMILAGSDSPVLRLLELRRFARAHVLHDPRTGRPTMSRAWEITQAGVAAALEVAAPARRRTGAAPEQIDIEEAIATSSGAARGASPSPHPTTPALTTPAGATVAALGRAEARGTKTLAPETPQP